MRPYKIIQGICYPHLVSGNKVNITADLSNPQSFYYDESIRLSDADLKNFKGKPICWEHDQSHVIGEISDVWKDSDGKMRMTGRIYTDTQEGLDMYNAINDRRAHSLSVGYDVNFDPDTKVVTGKNCYEISVCEKPFFEGAAVSVCASDKKKYNTNSKQLANFLISAMATETKLDENKDSSELAKVHDELLRKTEEQAKKLAEMEAMQKELAELKAAEAQRLVAYAEAQKPKLKEVLDLTEQQYKEENGADAVLPAEYRQSVENAFAHPSGAQAAAVITASAFSYKKQREQRLAMEKAIADLEAKSKQLVADHEVAMAHVKASERMHLSTETTKTPEVATVNANQKPLSMSNLFNVPVVPADWERKLYKEATGRDAPSSVSVNASAIVVSEPFHKEYFVNSLSNQEGGRIIYSHLFNNLDKFKSVPVKLTQGKLETMDY
jgi:hypothetical protein